MPAPKTFSATTWLSLQAASNKIGVTPATLRQWANQGRVRSFRTPGGHRRFSASEINALTGNSQGLHSRQRIETLVHSSLGRARLDITDGQLDKKSWYRRFDERGREIHRKLGRQLMIRLVQVLRDDESKIQMAREARKLGQEYGKSSIRANISLTDSLRAFLFFRDFVFEDLIGFSQGRENHSEPETIERYRRANEFINEILVAMVEIFSIESPSK